ncbi:unnamed protein product [Prunus brigantina]
MQAGTVIIQERPVKHLLKHHLVDIPSMRIVSCLKIRSDSRTSLDFAVTT